MKRMILMHMVSRYYNWRWVERWLSVILHDNLQLILILLTHKKKFTLKNFRSILAGICFLPFVASAQENLVVSRPVNFSQVTINDKFWGPKLNLVEDSTLKACIYQTEVATPRIRNFEKVARKKGEKHEGIFYDDSDVFKALEAMERLPAGSLVQESWNHIPDCYKNPETIVWVKLSLSAEA